MRFDFADMVDSLGKVPVVAASQYDDWNDVELFELWQERSAIMALDGGLTPTMAKYESSRWLIGEIGEKWFSRIESIARSRDESTQDNISSCENSNVALLPPNDIHKGGCRVHEHPTACPTNYLGVE